jgi:hypothetical protein
LCGQDTVLLIYAVKLSINNFNLIIINSFIYSVKILHDCCDLSESNRYDFSVEIWVPNPSLSDLSQKKERKVENSLRSDLQYLEIGKREREKMGSRAVACIVSCVLVLSMSFLASSRALVGKRGERGDLAMLGGWRNSERGSSAEIEELARFAVEEHNKKEVGRFSLFHS